MLSAPGQPRVAKGGKGPLLWMLVLAILGFVLFSLASVRQAPIMTPAQSSDIREDAVELVTPSTSLKFLIGARMNGGRAAVYSLDAKITALHSDLERFAAERNTVLELRQRFSQARLQAEYEGRWPIKAAGRSFDRVELKDVIDRTDRWLKQYESTVTLTESRITQCGIAVGQADRIILAMQRIQDELGNSGDLSAEGPGGRSGPRAQFQELAAQLDQILNDAAVKAPRLVLSPFVVEDRR